MVKASFDGYARLYNRTDEREVRRTQMRGSHEVDLPQGDGKASVSATRGFKNWFSTREAGMTVEATVSVTITCGQTREAISNAASAAGHMAEILAVEGSEEMGLHIDKFMTDVTGVGLRESLPPEPTRRSEKSLRESLPPEPTRRSEKKRRLPK
jgi:hypothetical protein